jgi:quinoprotein glucose dehydrogenase
VNDGWNKLRIVARGPRIQTFVNGHPVEDQTLEDLYKTHKKGFIVLQIHTVWQREIDLPVHAGLGITTRQPLMVKFRNIRIRPI